MLQIGEVQELSALLFGGVGFVEGPGKAQQRLGPGGGLPQIGQHRLRIAEKPVLPALQLRPAQGADLGQPLLDGGVLRIADHGPAEAENPPFHNFVPGLAGPELPELGQILPEDLAEALFDVGIGLHLPQGVFQLLCLPVQKHPELRHEIPAPGRLRRVGILRHVQRLNGLLHPAIHVRPAAHLPMGHFHGLRQAAVVAAVAEGLSHGEEVRVPVRVALLQ